MQETTSQNAKKLHCPNCKSHNIAISTETSVEGAVTSSFGGGARVSSTRFNNTHRNYWFCSDCGSKFRNIQNLEEEIAKVKKQPTSYTIGAVIFAIISIILFSMAGSSFLGWYFFGSFAVGCTVAAIVFFVYIFVAKNKLTNLTAELADLKQKCFD